MTANTTLASNGKTPWSNVRRESLALSIAEGVSMATSLGVVAVADTIAPNLVKDVSKTLAKVVFLPHLETFEKGVHFFTKLEDFQPDKTKSREERAEALGRATVLFGASWAASIILKLETRRFLNKHMGIVEEAIPGKKWWQPWKLTNHEKIIFAMDEGVHYGSIAIMNMSGHGAKVTDGMVNTTQNILQKVGLPERNAKEIANMLVVWELPNFLGLVAGMGGIAGIHHKQWDKKYGDWEATKPVKKFADKVLESIGMGSIEHSK